MFPLGRSRFCSCRSPEGWRRAVSGFSGSLVFFCGSSSTASSVSLGVGGICVCSELGASSVVGSSVVTGFSSCLPGLAMWKFRWRISSRRGSLFRSPTRAEILMMWILGSSPSSSDSLWMRRSCSPRGWRPLVAAAVPYPTLTLGGQPASSFLILLVTPRARLHAGFTRLYRQLSCRLNACLLMFAIFYFTFAGPAGVSRLVFVSM